MFVRITLIALICVLYTNAEAPFRKHYKFAKQLDSAPYAPSGLQPAVPFGLPTTPQPHVVYGPPASSYGLPADDPQSIETEENADAEYINQPSHLTRFEKLRQRNGQFRQAKNGQQKLQLQKFAKFSQPQQLVQPLQAVQPEGSYFIQLPNGAIQQVTYVAQPSPFDQSVSARLQFRPVAQAQAMAVADPQVFVNTLVQTYSARNN